MGSSRKGGANTVRRLLSRLGAMLGVYAAPVAATWLAATVAHASGRVLRFHECVWKVGTFCPVETFSWLLSTMFILLVCAMLLHHVLERNQGTRGASEPRSLKATILKAAWLSSALVLATATASLWTMVF